MNKKIIFVGCLTMLCHAAIATATDSVTMDELFQHVIETHPAFKIQDYRPQLTEKAMESREGSQDWNSYVNTYYSREKFDNDGDTFFGFDQVNNSNVSAGFGKNFWSFGGRLSLSHSVRRDDYDYDDNISGLSDGNYHSRIIANLTIPLWNNFGGVQDRSFYESLGYNLKIDRIAVKEAKENLLLDIAHNFLIIAQITENTNIIKSNTELAEVLKEFVKSGSSKKRDLNYAKLFVVESREQAANQDRILGQSKQQLATYLMFDKILNNNPEINLYKIEELESIDNLNQQLKKDSRVLAIQNILLQQLDHEKAVDLNDTSPDFDLRLASSVSGNDSELDDSYNKDSYDYTIGLRFSYPIGNTTARANLEQTNIRRMRASDSYRDAELELESLLRSHYENLQKYIDLLKVNVEAVEIAKDNRIEEFQSYKQGQTDIVFYIDSIREEQSARLRYAENAAQYQHSYFEYLALMDKLWLDADQDSAQ